MTAPVPSANAMAAELRGFVRDVSGLRSSLDARLSAQDRRLDALDRRALGAAGRPALSLADHRDAPYAKAMAAYLRAGDETALRALETKALVSGAPADGGHLVDPVTAETIATTLHAASSIRSVASVVTVEAGAYDVLVDHAEFAADWRAETSDQSETATPKIDRISISLHELSALPKASQRLLDDSAFDVEAWLATRIAERFARAENAAFVAGTGTDQPLGFLTAPAVADASWAWGSLGFVKTGAAGAFASAAPADALVDLIYALGAPYRRNARFAMNSTTAGVVRKFKDVDGRYLWSEATQEGEPARLFGYPVLIAEEMPDIDDAEDAIAFGDFKAGYTIAERPDLRLLRDPYSAKPHVLFYATKRVGGAVTDYAAIKLLRFAA